MLNRTKSKCVCSVKDIMNEEVIYLYSESMLPGTDSESILDIRSEVENALTCAKLENVYNIVYKKLVEFVEEKYKNPVFKQNRRPSQAVTMKYYIYHMNDAVITVEFVDMKKCTEYVLQLAAYNVVVKGLFLDRALRSAYAESVEARMDAIYNAMDRVRSTLDFVRVVEREVVDERSFERQKKKQERDNHFAEAMADIFNKHYRSTLNRRDATFTPDWIRGEGYKLHCNSMYTLEFIQIIIHDAKLKAIEELAERMVLDKIKKISKGMQVVRVRYSREYESFIIVSPLKGKVYRSNLELALSVIMLLEYARHARYESEREYTMALCMLKLQNLMSVVMGIKGYTFETVSFESYSEECEVEIISEDDIEIEDARDTKHVEPEPEVKKEEKPLGAREAFNILRKQSYFDIEDDVNRRAILLAIKKLEDVYNRAAKGASEERVYAEYELEARNMLGIAEESEQSIEADEIVRAQEEIEVAEAEVSNAETESAEEVAEDISFRNAEVIEEVRELDVEDLNEA